MAVSQTLTLTEVSVDNAANTSKVRILWQSTQTGESWNGYTRVAYYFTFTNGGVEREYSVSYTLPKETTVTLVDTIITVPHKSDGTGTLKVRTKMDTGISAGVVEKSKTLTLTTIPKLTLIDNASNIFLNELFGVQWIPHSVSYRYKLRFALGEWIYTTGLIHPNTKSLYTYTSQIPLSVASQITGSPPKGTMTVTLYTYLNTTDTTPISSYSNTFTVTVPDNAYTKPSVKMSLSPISSLPEQFNGLYIQNKTGVMAEFETEAKFGATISSCSMSVDGKTYESSYQSYLLYKYGTIPVTGKVTDSRGYSASQTQDIIVIPYSKPSIIPYNGESSIVCKRCDKEGNLTPSGTCLRIKVGMNYSKVVVDDVQKNFCLLRLQYKPEGSGTWSDWIDIISKESSLYAVDTVLKDINLSGTTTYLVQIEAIDDIGESSTMLITIPTEDCTFHLKQGGKAIGVGKYAEKDYIVDINDKWELNVRGNLRAGHIAEIGSYSGKDFNELNFATGYYYDSASPLSAGCSNYPVNEMGRSEIGVLEVISAGEFAYQTYRTYNGDVYMRSYYREGGWTAWKQLTLTDI